MTAAPANRWEDYGAPRRRDLRGRSVRSITYRLHVGHRVHYSTRHDSEACLDCDAWVEAPCRCKPEDDCPFPWPRPEKPSEVP